MEDNFKLEIVSPEKIIFADEVSMVTLPSYEGDMSILKNHISIITFLRPGIIIIHKNDKSLEKYFVQDGTIEYFGGNLVVLSTSIIDIKNLSKEFLENLSNDTQDKLANKNISDHDRYILNHKLDTLQQIRI